MNQDEREPLPDDTDEWIRLLQSDDGRAAREHLAAGRAIFYREPDTPAGLCIKKYPDGHQEWVRFDRKTGDEVLVCRLDDGDSGWRADALTRPDEKATLDLDSPRVPLDDFPGEAPFKDELNEAHVEERLAEVKSSTRRANDALDDALSSIGASNRRIDKMLSVRSEVSMSGKMTVDESGSGCATPWRTYHELFDQEFLYLEIGGVEFDVSVSQRNPPSVVLKLPRDLASRLGLRVGDRE